MQTRKHPRTLQEAFGPYTDHRIADHDTDYPPSWWGALLSIAFAALVLIWVTR